MKESLIGKVKLTRGHLIAEIPIWMLIAPEGLLLILTVKDVPVHDVIVVLPSFEGDLAHVCRCDWVPMLLI